MPTASTTSAVVERLPDLRRRRHRAERELVTVGHHALPVQRGDDRGADPLRHGHRLVAGADRAAAEHHHGRGRVPQDGGRADDRGVVRDGPHAARGEAVGASGGQVEHVDRDPDVDGSRPPRLEHLVGPRERLGQLRRVGDDDRLRRDGAHERLLVGQVVERADLLPAVAAVRVGADHEHRDRVVERARHRRRGVRQAGARDQHADAGLAGDPRVGVGHEAGALLVPRGDVADVGRGEPAVDLQRVHAGDAEDGVGAVLLEQADDGLAGRCHAVLPRSVGRTRYGRPVSCCRP